MFAFPLSTSRCPVTVSADPIEKSPSRAWPFATVRRLSGPGSGTALRSARSTASGRLRSLRSTVGPPGAGAMVAGLGLGGLCVIWWTTNARKVSMTSLTWPSPCGLAWAAGASTKTKRPRAAGTRLAVGMGHPLSRDREEAPECEDAAHVHEGHRRRGEGQPARRIDEAPETAEPGLLDQVQRRATQTHPGPPGGLAREPVAGSEQRVPVGERPRSAGRHGTQQHEGKHGRDRDRLAGGEQPAPGRLERADRERIRDVHRGHDPVAEIGPRGVEWKRPEPRDQRLFGAHQLEAVGAFVQMPAELGRAGAGEPAVQLVGTEMLRGRITGHRGPLYDGDSGKVSLAQVRERLPQLIPRSMDVRLHRAQRKVQNFGDFLVCPALHVAEQNARAVLGPEPRDRLLDLPAELPRLHLVERGLLPVADLERRRLDRLRRLRVRGTLERERVQLAPPEMIDGRVVRDLEDPGRELVLRAVRFDRV